jgi:hypothetical protein
LAASRRFAGVSEDRQILSSFKITQKEVGEKKNFFFLLYPVRR